LVDQPLPFLLGSEHEQSAEDNREQAEREKWASAIAFESLSRGADREAAGQQTDRVEDRRLEDVAWTRTRDTLTDVKEIRDDENREDGRLRNDQRRHPDLAAIGQPPRGGHFDGRSGDGFDGGATFHRSLPTRNGYPDLPDACDPTTDAGWRQ